MDVRTSVKVKLPSLSAHWTLLIHSLQIQPLDNTMHVEAMCTDAPYQWTIIAGKRTFWTRTLKRHTTNATIFIICYPTP